MNIDELIKFCLINQDAVYDYPWSDKKYKNIPVLRNKKNKKWFALIFELDNQLCVNLKCKPEDSWILQDLYSFITPAWHMNKKHWIKVEVNKAPKDLLKNLVINSFNLIK
mgnify:FL=1